MESAAGPGSEAERLRRWRDQLDRLLEEWAFILPAAVVRTLGNQREEIEAEHERKRYGGGIWNG